jgi:glycine cleavage system H protein
MSIPENLRYSKTHEWLKVDGDIATVGITDHAQSELGDIVFVEVNLNIEVDFEGPVGTIEAVKTVSDIFAPVSGKVTEVNEKVKETPEIINKDPYGEGWILKMTIKDKNEINNLLDSAAYKALIGR